MGCKLKCSTLLNIETIDTLIVDVDSMGGAVGGGG